MAKVLLSPSLWFWISLCLAFAEFAQSASNVASKAAEDGVYDDADFLYRIFRAARRQFRLNGRMILKMLLIISVFWSINFGIYHFFGLITVDLKALHWPWVKVPVSEIVVSCIFSAFLEEILCRGLTFRFLKRCSNTPLAIFLSAAMFALSHTGRAPAFVIAHLLSGVELVLIYIWTESLVPSMISHAGYNLLVYALC